MDKKEKSLQNPTQSVNGLPGLNGLRVAVTAGANGIGLGIARFLDECGVKLAICDVDEKAISSTQEELPQAIMVKADVAKPEEVEMFFKIIQDRLGGLDGLVNNAGIAGPTKRIENITLEEWKQCIDIDLTGQFLCAKNAVPLLRKSEGGTIVNISSVAGKYGYPFRSPYASAKFGIIGFTQTLAKELGKDNIRANAVLPGIVKGPRIEGVISKLGEQLGVSYAEAELNYLSKISLRRMVTSRDVAAAVAFLLSDFGYNISGQSLGVDANVETL